MLNNMFEITFELKEKFLLKNSCKFKNKITWAYLFVVSCFLCFVIFFPHILHVFIVVFVAFINLKNIDVIDVCVYVCIFQTTLMNL